MNISDRHSTVFVAGLAIYPVKGLRGLDLESAVIERQGLEHDRRWAVLRPDGRVLTQRELPGMARIDAVPEAGGVRLECAGHGGVHAVAGAVPITLNVWGTRVPAVVANAEGSAWLSRVLGQDCTLAYLADPAARLVTPSHAQPGDVVSLADGFPLLVTTTASLAALNARLDPPIPMNRFRPNLVLDGDAASIAPWVEDGWAAIELPGVRLRMVSACVRCTVTTLDHRTGVAAPRKEPLRTLGRIHRNTDGGICFGMNATPERLGSVQVGEAVRVILR